jgi:hypothetical protein
MLERVKLGTTNFLQQELSILTSKINKLAS